LSASNPNVSIQWQVSNYLDNNNVPVYEINIAINGTTKLTDLLVSGGDIVENMKFSFYRIAGRLGWCAYAPNTNVAGPLYGGSILETDDITQNWSQLTYTITGSIYYPSNVTQYTFSNMMHTISQIPTEFQLPRIASTNPIVSLCSSDNQPIEKLQQMSAMKIHEHFDEDLGVFIVTQSDLGGAPEVFANVGAINTPLCNFIPGEVSSQLGFYYSGLPVNGQIPRYQFSAVGSYSVISSDFSAIANGDVQPIIVASRSIPLRGVAFDEFGNSIDLSILDSITVDYSNAQTFQAYFRPPIYTSVANKSEMILTDLRFDLLDIDGVSPFDCLQGGSIVLNIRGASF
jgi:hypothetical protein